jgi:peptide/nickel transport system permease protein
MLRYIARRAVQSAAGLTVLIIAVFFLARLTGDPAKLLLPINADQALIDEFRAREGLDKPVIEQFGRFVWNVLHGDFGTSLRRHRPALDMVLEAYPVTLQLAFTAMALVLVSASVIGSLAAYRPGSGMDRTVTVSSLVSASMPDFWVAISAILLFAVTLRVLPTSGYGADIRFWILPVAVLVLRPFGMLVQVVRASMISALSSAYVRTARVKGMSESRLIYVHALRNAFLPIITVAADQTVGMINGLVIIESIFGFPGIGKLMIDAVLSRDFPVVQASILVTAIAIFTLFILVDLIYVILDPRIRHS